MEEFGLTSDYVSEDNAASYYRQLLHNTLLAGATGWLAWNNADYDDLYDVELLPAPPVRDALRLFDQHSRPKAQALEVQAFGGCSAGSTSVGSAAPTPMSRWW